MILSFYDQKYIMYPVLNAIWLGVGMNAYSLQFKQTYIFPLIPDNLLDTSEATLVSSVYVNMSSVQLSLPCFRKTRRDLKY